MPPLFANCVLGPVIRTAAPAEDYVEYRQSDIDRIRSILSGQTGSGSMIFSRPDPDPDISVLKIVHLFYDNF